MAWFETAMRNMIDNFYKGDINASATQVPSQLFELVNKAIPDFFYASDKMYEKEYEKQAFILSTQLMIMVHYEKWVKYSLDLLNMMDSKRRIANQLITMFLVSAVVAIKQNNENQWRFCDKFFSISEKFDISFTKQNYCRWETDYLYRIGFELYVHDQEMADIVK